MCRTSTFVDEFINQYPTDMVYKNEYMQMACIGYLTCAMKYCGKYKKEAERIWKIFVDITLQNAVETKYTTPQALEEAIRNEVQEYEK